jgi:5-methylcytosine-specific restriction endonuclease McrA
MPIVYLCPTCYEPAGTRPGKCDPCRRTYERTRSRRRRATSQAVRVRDSRAWQRMRDLARRRDGGCVHRGDGGCHGRLEVHHINALERGGTNGLGNLVTLCRRHHEQAEANFFTHANSDANFFTHANSDSASQNFSLPDEGAGFLDRASSHPHVTHRETNSGLRKNSAELKPRPRFSRNTLK